MRSAPLRVRGASLPSRPHHVVSRRLRAPQQSRRQSLLRASAPDAPVRPFHSDSAHLKDWSPDFWRKFEARQQPQYPDDAQLRSVIDTLRTYPPLVFAGECRQLQSRLAAAAHGDAFVLQGGDCAEAFSQFNANRIRDSYRVLLQMGLVLTFGGSTPVVKMGRMAGQFAKPRSAPFEERDGEELPSYRGDIINASEFTAEARVPNPSRLVSAYNQSAATLNLLRGFSSGGYASLDRVANWDLEFMDNSKESKMYLDLAHRVQEALMFMKACGLEPCACRLDLFGPIEFGEGGQSSKHNKRNREMQTYTPAQRTVPVEEWDDLPCRPTLEQRVQGYFVIGLRVWTYAFFSIICTLVFVSDKPLPLALT